MLLRTLVAAPGLRLRVLAGDSDLDRPITGVYTTDLLDPRRYLSGGELVLTGLMWRRSEADSAAFVATLAGAGVAALAAGDDDRAGRIAAQAAIKQTKRRHNRRCFVILGERERLLHLRVGIAQGVFAERGCNRPELIARRAVKMHVPRCSEGVRGNRTKISVLGPELMGQHAIRARFVAHIHLFG